jgi:hypothetical protein
MKLSNLLNKPTSSVSELAKKYKVSPAVVDKQLAQGIKIEMEHTSLKSVAREIAMDHLGEDLHYYEKLSKIEKIKVQEHQLVELFDLNKVPEGVRPPVYDSQEGGNDYYVFRVDQKTYTCLFNDLGDQTYDFKFRDPEKRTSITGAGDAAKVFWGVAKTIDMFVKSHKVNMLKFGASEPSRQKLYNVLSQKLADTLGWKREVVKHPDDPASYFRLYNPQYAKQSLDEGRSTSVIVVDVQPEYSGMMDGDENPVFNQIIRFVNNQTGPVLMFVNAEDQGMTGDTVQDVKLYWEDTIRGEDVDRETNPHPINWNRFQIVDKGYGYFRSWMDNNISARTIIKTIRLMYQNRVNDSRELFGGEESDDYTVNFKQFIGNEFEPWMLDDPISINWTSVAQLKRFSGSYIVGGGRNECLREVELLMNAFNFKYKRIDSMVYG